MHAGAIANDTAAGRLYRFLFDNLGQWFTSLEIAVHTQTVCPSTRASEVRKQLPSWLSMETRRRGRVWEYRLVREKAA